MLRIKNLSHLLDNYWIVHWTVYYANCLIVPRKASLAHFQGYSEHQAMFTNRVNTEYKHNPRTRNTEYRLTPVEYIHTTYNTHTTRTIHHNTHTTQSTQCTGTHTKQSTHIKKRVCWTYTTQHHNISLQTQDVVSNLTAYTTY